VAHPRPHATPFSADLPFSDGVLEHAPDSALDDLTLLAAQLCDAPAAALTLVDGERVLLASHRGIEAGEIPRELAFCTRELAGVAHGRFYAAIPLSTTSGEVLGALGVLHDRPHELTSVQAEGLRALGRQAASRIELQRKLLEQERASASALLVEETESRYRTLVEQLPLAVYVFELHDGFRLLYRSPQVEGMLGYSTDEWLADPELFPKLLHPEDHDRVMAEVSRADERGEPFSSDFRLLARDGRVVWVHDEHVTIRDAEGRPQYVQGYMIDVTAAKEAEERLRATEGRFRALAEQLPLATYIDAPDASGNSYVSPQIEAMTGYSTEDFLGDTETFAKLLHPDDRERVLEAIARSAEAATPLSHEYRVVTRDGRTLWLRDSAVTVRDGEGRPSYRQGYAVDITAAKQAEERLREAEEKYRTLVEHLPLVTYAVEPGESSGHGVAPEPERLVYMSPQIEELVGLTAEEWMNDPDSFWRVLHPEDRERVRADLRTAFDRPGSLVLEYRFVHRDGRIVWVHDEMATRRDEEGRPLYAQGYLVDVTERKRAADELERLLERERAQNAELRTLDKLKDEFIALVSHELRTPLTSIRGYLELVPDGSSGPLTGEQEQFLGIVDRNAERLHNLVGDLLFIAQIEAGRLALERDELDIARIAEESIETGRPLAGEKGIELTLVTEPVAPLLGDRGRLGQLVDNFVSNAIKFTPAGGRVVVRVLEEGGSAVIEVSDTGMGIPDAEQDRLFERFFRTSTATAQAIQGTGLGLTISKAIAEAHGGRISFTSVEGEGTTFRIGLPLAPALADAA
jgi:PAS domain S-box-containing protein